MREIIEIEDLVFDYAAEYTEEDGVKHPPKRAIDGVSLKIEKGTFTAVIGRNGSGKSTLARNLNGLLLPTEGVIYVNGLDTRNEDDIWNIRQTAGMVFQNPDNQLVSSIVEDDVAFGPENLGVDPKVIRKRVDAALEAVSMTEFRKNAPHLLSGGQKQRIAIAGILAMEPEIIIFDEPTAMLDPSGRKDIMKIIEELHERGITVVLITHFMEEAVKADRVVIMDMGKILLDGSPDEVFSKGDLIRSVSLDVPMAVEIADKLRERGIAVPNHVTDSEKLVEFVCQYK
jgi:energy-coupling factor transport system ATP-binding protein